MYGYIYMYVGVYLYMYVAMARGRQNNIRGAGCISLCVSSCVHVHAYIYMYAMCYCVHVCLGVTPLTFAWLWRRGCSEGETLGVRVGVEGQREAQQAFRASFHRLIIPPLMCV